MTKEIAKKVMIVDDDPGVLEVLARALTLHGYQVDTSTIDGPALVDRIKRGDIGLILLDIMLSGQDGRTIARELKNNPATSTTPIVVMSANPLFRDSALKSGADMFVEKPFSMQDLLGIAGTYMGPVKE